MKIGIDARFYGEAGPGRYVKNIIEHLEKLDKENTYYIYLRKKGYSKYTTSNKNFIKILADVPWYSWYEQIVFLWYVLKSGLDLLYVPHFNIPVLYPFHIVTAIPDIIMHTYSTEKGTTLPKPYFKFKKLVYRVVLTWALIKSKFVIVPSNDVKDDMLKHYPYLNDSKFILAYEGVDPVFALDESSTVDLTKFGIYEKYLLYISSMYEHKNVKRLIDAYDKLVNNYGYKGQLVLIGKKDKFSDDIQSYVESRNLKSKVIMPGHIRYVEDHELNFIRNNADLYVFPSLKEGFSLTPLEAQYVGLPCVISDIPCHREVFGESVQYFDPLSVDDMAAKIYEVLVDNNKWSRLRELGYAQVKKYDWLKTAEITLNVFRDVLQGK